MSKAGEDKLYEWLLNLRKEGFAVPMLNFPKGVADKIEKPN